MLPELNSFAVYITGDYRIGSELEFLSKETNIIDLLTVDKKVIRTKYVTCINLQAEGFKDVLALVQGIVGNLKSDVTRVKIKCPYYRPYVKNALYIEANFTPYNNHYPISRNAKTQELTAVDRVYEKSCFDNFRVRRVKEKIWLCLYDTFIEGDLDWFQMYESFYNACMKVKVLPLI